MSVSNLQNLLRQKTNELYNGLLNDFYEWIEPNGDSCVPFRAIVGKKFQQERNSGIVFYGRCNNGWNAYNTDGSDKELEDFFTRKSPFLNLMYWEYWYFHKEDWMDYSVYNNVAKMVPDGQGNCSDDLWEKQYDRMMKIIQIENEVLSPEFTILVLGNTNGSNGWESPFKELGFLQEQVDKIDWEGGSCSVYMYKEQYFILTDRPERRKIEPHADAIRKLIEKYHHPVSTINNQ